MDKVKNISITYGTLTAICCILYFLMLSLYDLHEKPWLRIFNGVIMAGGIYLSIKQYKKATNNHLTYFSGFRTGLFTGFISTIIFVVFMAVYMFHLNPEFPKAVMDTWFEDYNQGPGILVFLLFVEGLSSSMILTLTIMQGQKDSWNSRYSKNIHQKAQ